MLTCKNEKHGERRYKIGAGTRIVYFPRKGNLWFENDKGEMVETFTGDFCGTDFYLHGLSEGSVYPTVRFLAALFGCEPEEQERSASDEYVRYVLVRDDQVARNAPAPARRGRKKK